MAKPNGLVVVEAGTEQALLEPLPIGLVWGIGPVTEKRLHARGITTIGELSRSSPDHLRSLLGSAASEVLVARASNVDERRVARRRASSVGAQSACGRQRPTDEFLRSTLGLWPIELLVVCVGLIEPGARLRCACGLVSSCCDTFANGE